MKITDNFEVVKNIRTLKAMEKAGLIKFCRHTGKKIKGIHGGDSFTCNYIDEAPSLFSYNGDIYGEKYFDGCFYPYVVLSLNQSN